MSSILPELIVQLFKSKTCRFFFCVCYVLSSILLQEKGYVTADVAKEQDLHQLKLSGTKFRQLLRSGADIPEWFAFKSVVDVLREATPTK